MARTVSGPRPGVEREYIPLAFENREDPDPLKVWIRDPSESDKRALIGLQMSLQGTNTPSLDLSIDTMIKWQSEAVKRHVMKVAGYTVRGVEITTGEELADHGESEIVAEVALELFAAASLDDDEKKQFEERSGSKLAATNLSDGIVGNVGSSGGTDLETVTDPKIAVSYM